MFSHSIFPPFFQTIEAKLVSSSSITSIRHYTESSVYRLWMSLYFNHKEAHSDSEWMDLFIHHLHHAGFSSSFTPSPFSPLYDRYENYLTVAEQIRNTYEYSTIKTMPSIFFEPPFLYCQYPIANILHHRTRRRICDISLPEQPCYAFFSIKNDTFSLKTKDRQGITTARITATILYSTLLREDGNSKQEKSKHKKKKHSMIVILEETKTLLSIHYSEYNPADAHASIKKDDDNHPCAIRCPSLLMNEIAQLDNPTTCTVCFATLDSETFQHYLITFSCIDWMEEIDYSLIQRYAPDWNLLTTIPTLHKKVIKSLKSSPSLVISDPSPDYSIRLDPIDGVEYHYRPSTRAAVVSLPEWFVQSRLTTIACRGNRVAFLGLRAFLPSYISQHQSCLAEHWMEQNRMRYIHHIPFTNQHMKQFETIWKESDARSIELGGLLQKSWKPLVTSSGTDKQVMVNGRFIFHTHPMYDLFYSCADVHSYMTHTLPTYRGNNVSCLVVNFGVITMHISRPVVLEKKGIIPRLLFYLCCLKALEVSYEVPFPSKTEWDAASSDYEWSEIANQTIGHLITLMTFISVPTIMGYLQRAVDKGRMKILQEDIVSEIQNCLGESETEDLINALQNVSSMSSYMQPIDQMEIFELYYYPFKSYQMRYDEENDDEENDDAFFVTALDIFNNESLNI